MSDPSDNSATAHTQDEPDTPKRPKERLLRNTIANVAAKALSRGFHVLTAIKQTRFLGENTWGLFSYLLLTIDVFRVITSFGLDVVTIRLMAVGEHSPRTVERHLMLLKTALCLACLAVVAGASLVVPRFGEQRGLLLLLCAGLFPWAYMESLTVRFQVDHLMERLIWVQVAAGAIYLGGVYAGAWAGFGVPGFVALYVGFQLLCFVLTLGVNRRTFPRRGDQPDPGGVDRALLRRMVRDGIPVGLLEVLSVVYSRLAVYLLELFGSLAVVGHYYFAIRLSEPLLAVASALSVSAFPVLSRLVQQGEGKELKRRVVLYSGRSALLTCTICTAMALAAGPLLGLIKPEHLAATGALQALSLATVFMFQNQFSTSVINSFGKYHYVTVFAAINLTVFVALSLTLVPRLGPTGAGLSTLGTEGINAVVQLTAVTLLVRRLAAADSDHS